MWAERALSLAGGDEGEALAPKLRALRLVLLLALGTEMFLALRPHAPSPSPPPAVALQLGAVGLLVWLAAVLVWRRVDERLVTALALGLLLTQYARAFPLVANHQFLGAVCLFLLVFFDVERGEERPPLLHSLRWLLAVLFFYTGLQKLLYGLYVFRGEYFAYVIATRKHLADFLEVLAPQAEVERLHAIGGVAIGAGPYALESLPLLLAANLTVAAEMTLPVFLLWRRTRPLAVLASLGLIAAIQLGAHELVFGAMFSSLVLLFARRDWLTPLLPVFAMGALVMLALRFWLAPDWRFG